MFSHTGKVGVFANIGHGRQYLGQRVAVYLLHSMLGSHAESMPERAWIEQLDDGTKCFLHGVEHQLPPFFPICFFLADSSYWMLLSGADRFSGMVPPSSLMVWRTLRPTS